MNIFLILNPGLSIHLFCTPFEISSVEIQKSRICNDLSRRATQAISIEGGVWDQNPVHFQTALMEEAETSSWRKFWKTLKANFDNPVQWGGMYRGPGIYGVKGSVPILFLELHHRGEGEKREGVQISKNSTQNLWHHKFLAPCILFRRKHQNGLSLPIEVCHPWSAARKWDSHERQQP